MAWPNPPSTFEDHVTVRVWMSDEWVAHLGCEWVVTARLMLDLDDSTPYRKRGWVLVNSSVVPVCLAAFPDVDYQWTALSPVVFQEVQA